MKISRWTRTRLQIVAVVAAIAALAAVTIGWLRSHVEGFVYDFAELENGVRNGITVGALLAAVDLLYMQGPRGAWLRRLSFGRAVLIRALLYTAIIVASFTFNRLLFGLLHGFGFAGALSEVGLPQMAIPVALLFFNVGVEIGQLLFIAAAVAFMACGRKIGERFRPATFEFASPTGIRLLPPYAIGSVAMFWVIQRIAGF